MQLHLKSQLSDPFPRPEYLFQSTGTLFPENLRPGGAAKFAHLPHFHICHIFTLALTQGGGGYGGRLLPSFLTCGLWILIARHLSAEN